MNNISHINKHLCFETLANPLRLNIIELLKIKPHSVTELAEKLNVERSRVSHSLIDLRKCKYVDVKNEGKNKIYSLKKGTILTRKVSGDVFQIIEEHSETQCCGDCHKLKAK